MPRPSLQKHYIYVPYKDKEEAKGLGAKWCSESKKWYVPNNVDLNQFSKWLSPQGNAIDMNEVYDQFSKALFECGLIANEPIMDGKLRRVKVDGDKGSEKSGAYVGYLDGYPAGFIENFKTGQRIAWKFQRERGSQKIVSNANVEAIKKANEIKAAQRADERLRLNEKTAVRLQEEYKNASNLQGKHSYLQAKGIESSGLKVDRFGNLLIPLHDTSGKMWSMQRIAPNGNKIIGVIKTQSEKDSGKEYAARKKGCFYTSTPLDSHKEFFICEGFATAKSVEILLSKPTIMAVDSGNLLSVCEALLEKYPHKHITICADNDLKGKINRGFEAALKCKEKYPQIHIIKPSIADREISDFNDLMRIKGKQTARADIQSQLVAQSIEHNTRNKDYER